MKLMTWLIRGLKTFAMVSVMLLLTNKHFLAHKQFQPQAECNLNVVWRDSFNEMFLAFSQHLKTSF